MDYAVYRLLCIISFGLAITPGVVPLFQAAFFDRNIPLYTYPAVSHAMCTIDKYTHYKNMGWTYPLLEKHHPCLKSQICDAP